MRPAGPSDYRDKEQLSPQHCPSEGHQGPRQSCSEGPHSKYVHADPVSDYPLGLTSSVSHCHHHEWGPTPAPGDLWGLHHPPPSTYSREGVPRHGITDRHMGHFSELFQGLSKFTFIYNRGVKFCISETKTNH